MELIVVITSAFVGLEVRIFIGLLHNFIPWRWPSARAPVETYVLFNYLFGPTYLHIKKT